MGYLATGGVRKVFLHTTLNSSATLPMSPKHWVLLMVFGVLVIIENWQGSKIIAEKNSEKVTCMLIHTDERNDETHGGWNLKMPNGGRHLIKKEKKIKKIQAYQKLFFHY